MTARKHAEIYRAIDDDACGVCTDGMVCIITAYRPDEYLPAAVFQRADDARRTHLAQTYGSLDTVPRGFDQPAEERGTASMMACLCRLGRLKNETKRLRSVAEVYSDADIARLWPNGVPNGMARPERAMQDAGVPAACTRFSLTTFQQKFEHDKTTARYVKYAATWAKTARADRSDLMLYGPQGTGKTGLAVACLRACLEQSESCRFWTVKELAIYWRSAFGRKMLDSDEDSEHDMLHKLLAPDVLVLDEVTGSKMTDFIEDTLTLIIDQRQKALKPTVLTLNVSADTSDDTEALSTMLGPSLFDRLRERSQTWPMKGDSKRTNYSGRR